jgi:hypothetical protein
VKKKNAVHVPSERGHELEPLRAARRVGVWNEVLVAGKERGVVLSVVHRIHFLPPSSGLL